MGCKVIKKFPLYVDCSGEQGVPEIVNLTYTASTSNGVVNNDAGTGFTIPAVGANAGLMTPALLLSLQSQFKVISITNASNGDVIEHGMNGTILMQFIDGLQVMGGFYGQYLDANNSIFRTPVSGTFTGYLLCIKLA